MHNELQQPAAQAPARRLFGLELRKKEGDYVAILPEPDGSEKARLLFYGERGLIYHETYETGFAARDEAITRGYVEEVVGQMDRLSYTEQWKEGMASLEAISQLNAGQIDWTEFQRRMAAITKKGD